MFCTFSLPNVLGATNSMHFFKSSTAKSAPKLKCFLHFHFHMCFAPQQRANFHVSSASAPAALGRRLFDPPLLIFSMSDLLPSLCCFSICPSNIVGSLASKLPSIICGNCGSLLIYNCMSIYKYIIYIYTYYTLHMIRHSIVHVHIYYIIIYYSYIIYIHN